MAENITIAAQAQRAQWLRVLQEFGTHYTHRVTFGGKRILYTTFDRQDAERFRGTGIDLESAMAYTPSAIDPNWPSNDTTFLLFTGSLRKQQLAYEAVAQSSLKIAGKVDNSCSPG